MDKKTARLLDATKKLLNSNTPEEEIIKSLNEVGVGFADAKNLIKQAQQEQKSGSDSQFKSFVGKKEKKPEKKPGFLGGLFGKKNKDENTDNWLEEEISGDEGDTEEFFEELESGSEEEPKDKDFFKSVKPLKHSTVGVFSRKRVREILPTRVSDFDKLIDRGGLKRGDTILISGGCGTGKTTFGMQSLYNGAMNGEKGVYITLEERPEKMKENLMQNYGWDLEKAEQENSLAIIKIDPLTIARAVEATLTKERGGLYIELDKFELPFQFNLPFKPDRVVVDSLSALSIAFMENEQGYRQYLRHLFETLEGYNSVNLVLGETEQEPGIYSRSGIEEFLADGVVVFYNVKIHNLRQRAMEILKLRSSKHVRKLTPYTIGPNGIEIFINQEIFSES